MSVTSSTEIVNLSFDLLSIGTVSNIVTPSSPTEAMAARWYNHKRKSILRSHPWNFASKRAILSASSTAPAFGYAAAFPVPGDFLRLNSIQDGSGQDLPSGSYSFENVGSQRCILTAAGGASARLRYVYDITDVALFDPLFVDLFVIELALAFAYKSTESNGNVQRIAELRKEAERISKAIDGQENPPVAIIRSVNRQARRDTYSQRADKVIF